MNLQLLTLEAMKIMEHFFNNMAKKAKKYNALKCAIRVERKFQLDAGFFDGRFRSKVVPSKKKKLIDKKWKFRKELNE